MHKKGLHTLKIESNEWTADFRRCLLAPKLLASAPTAFSENKPICEHFLPGMSLNRKVKT